MSKERPILFSAPMVRAILEGRKTQTRRTIKPQPDEDGLAFDLIEQGWFDTSGRRYRCPFGSVGDRLWVRETHLIVGGVDAVDPRVVYRATNDGPNAWLSPSWRPSIYMPRWASRITLEITGVRVERLQEIKEDDAKAEGVEYLYSDELIRQRPELAEKVRSYKNYLWHGDFGQYGMGNKQSDNWPHQFSNYREARGSFSSLWALINGPESWDKNPWVWVIEFKEVLA